MLDTQQPRTGQARRHPESARRRGRRALAADSESVVARPSTETAGQTPASDAKKNARLMLRLQGDGTNLVCRYGTVQPLPTLIHEPDNGRPCVHLVGTMPKVICVCRAPVERLNFQPRFTAEPILPRGGRYWSTVRPGVIAARRDLLILSVELIGPIEMRHADRGKGTPNDPVDQRVQHHWRYALHDVEDDPDILIAVRQ